MPRIATLLLLVASLASLAQAGPTKAKSASVHALKGRLSGVRDRKSTLRAKLVQTRTQVKTVKRTIVVVDDGLQSVRASLAETHRELVVARRAQGVAAKAVLEATEEMEISRTRARLRLRALGKQGTANVLAAFVTAQSAGDLASRQDVMARIARRDHEIFARVKETRRRLAARKKARDAAMARVSLLESREKGQQARLREFRARKGQELADLGQEAAGLESRLRQFDEDEREIQRLIAIANRPRPRPGRKPPTAFIGRFMRPVDGPVTSGFGMRYHPILHRTRLHAGIDFGAAIGTPVHAAGPGAVVAATRMRGFGNVVIIDHGGVSTVYAHLSRIGVSFGARVSQGQTIGAVGMTGLATGPHLHWEVPRRRSGGQPDGTFLERLPTMKPDSRRNPNLR